MALSHDPNWPRAGAWHTPTGDVDFGIIGVPTYSTSITPGSAHLTPAAVRDAIPRYSEVFLAEGEIHTAARLARHDFGDVNKPDADEKGAIRAIAEAVSRTRLLVALGGDNALTVPVAVAGWGTDVATAGLITVDAHLDVRDGISNGSPVRRLIEEVGVDPARVVQIAIADFANSAEYLKRVRDWGVTIITRDDVARRGVDAVVHEALAIAGADGGPIHVDLDIDACDRAVAPACPASIPGGLTAYEMRQFARGFARDDRVRTMDLAEVRRENARLAVQDDMGDAIPKIDDGPWPAFPADLTSIALAARAPQLVRRLALVDVLPTGTAEPVDFLAPGVLALAVMSTAMVSLGIATGFERSYHVLKRLGLRLCFRFGLRLCFDGGQSGLFSEGALLFGIDFGLHRRQAFLHARFGLGEAHGKGMALQLNWFLDHGAITARKDGTFAGSRPASGSCSRSQKWSVQLPPDCLIGRSGTLRQRSGSPSRRRGPARCTSAH